MKSPCICIHPQNRPCGRDCDGKPDMTRISVIEAAGEGVFGSAWPSSTSVDPPWSPFAWDSPTAGTINPPTADPLSPYQRVELERLEAQLADCLKALREVLGRS